MEELSNLTQDDVLELISDFPVKPLGRKVIVTLNMDESEELGLGMTSGLDEYQYIVATGGVDRDYKPGDKVLLDLERMMEYVPAQDNTHEKVGRIKIRPITIKDRVFGLINDNVIDAIDVR